MTAAMGADLPVARASERNLQSSSTVRGVRLGLETFSLVPNADENLIDQVVACMRRFGIGYCSLQEYMLLPPELRAVSTFGKTETPTAQQTPEQRAEAKRVDARIHDWRTTVPIESLRAVQAKFRAAGVELIAFMTDGLTSGSSDAEMERVCDMAQALGVNYVASTMRKSVAKRFATVSMRYGLTVGLQGEASMKPTQDMICTPQDYLEALSWSPNFRIQLDIGNAAGNGYDVVGFVKPNIEKFGSLMLKDRTSDYRSVPWGQGIAHVTQVLRIVRDSHAPVPCFVDCDYPTAPGRTRVDDIGLCFRTAQDALNS
jgi:hypothetical protein